MDSRLRGHDGADCFYVHAERPALWRTQDDTGRKVTCRVALTWSVTLSVTSNPDFFRLNLPRCKQRGFVNYF